MSSADPWGAEGRVTATVLPEGQPYARLFDVLDGLLSAGEAGPAASG